MAETEKKKSVADRAKELLADPRERIVLDAFINAHLRAVLEGLSPEQFPVTGGGNNQDFIRRVARYEDAVRDVMVIAILLARWGEAEGQLQLEKIFLRVAETVRPSGGTVAWLNLRWYPLIVLMYAVGIAALFARRFDILAVTLTARVHGESGSNYEPLVSAVLAPLTNLDESFKVLPGHERDRYPRSEHQFVRLREPLEQLLFLGGDYEPLFDRFEVLLALAFADFRDPSGQGDVWGPPGRFAYKQGRSNSPMDLLIEEATSAGDSWPLLTSGLFGGKSARLLRVADAYRQLIKRHGRW
jgi:hypothetical protein